MRLDELFKNLGYLAATIGSQVRDTAFDGVPLEELDLTATPPHKVALLGPAQLVLTEGEVFRVDVEPGPSGQQVRFSLEEGRLGVGGGDSDTVVSITLPAPKKLTSSFSLKSGLTVAQSPTGYLAAWTGVPEASDVVEYAIVGEDLALVGAIKDLPTSGPRAPHATYSAQRGEFGLQWSVGSPEPTYQLGFVNGSGALGDDRRLFNRFRKVLAENVYQKDFAQFLDTTLAAAVLRIWR